MPRTSASRFAGSLPLLLVLLAGGCRAQVPPADRISPDTARRIALTIRSKAQLPFNYDVKVGERKPSTQAGWDEVTVFLGEEGKPSKPMTFLISKDGKSLAQMNTFDLSKDPKTLVSDAGRPFRGSEKAPVDIVVFDDLECPFCARMHAQMFPAVLNRYGDKVRIAYKDNPLTQIHPWATHAAVDADCLAQQSNTGYWNLVDHLHEQLADIGKDPAAKPGPDGKEPEKTLAVATAQLDKATLDEGKKQKVNEGKLQACVTKQDDAPVKAGLAEGEQLNVNGVPALFINGEMITGAVPIEYVYRAIDSALTAQGIAPPPPVPIPSLDAPEAGRPAKSN